MHMGLCSVCMDGCAREAIWSAVTALPVWQYASASVLETKHSSKRCAHQGWKLSSQGWCSACLDAVKAANRQLEGTLALGRVDDNYFITARHLNLRHHAAHSRHFLLDCGSQGRAVLCIETNSKPPQSVFCCGEELACCAALNKPAPICAAIGS